MELQAAGKFCRILLLFYSTYKRTFIQLDFSFDFLSLYDGDSKSAPLIGKYCGNTVPSNHITLGNDVFIYFQSDGENTRQGFKLHYQPYSKDIHPYHL
jgi:hypothetical protein